MKDKTSLNIRGYGVPFSRLSKIEIDALRRELTVEPDMGPGGGYAGGFVRSFPFFKESVSKIYVPKYYGLEKFGMPEEDPLYKSDYFNTFVPPSPIKPMQAAFKGDLRPEQKDAVSCFIKACQDPLKRGGIINLSCGGGKTVIAIHIISLLKMKTMIIVHKTFLLDQWRERIQHFLPEARVGIVKAQTTDVEDKDIIIGSLQSLSMKEYSPRLFEDIGLCIVDEIHRTGTEVFSQALAKFNFMFSLGLTATLERKDGLTKVFQWAVGDVVYQNKTRKDTVDIQTIKYFDENPDYNTVEMMANGKVNASKLLTQICQYAPRTMMIAELIVKTWWLSDQKRRFLILSDRKQHLQDLFRNISELLTSSKMPTCLLPEKNDEDKPSKKIKKKEKQEKQKSIVPFLKDEDDEEKEKVLSKKWSPFEEQMARDEIGFYIGGMKEAELKASENKTFILATYNYVSEGCDLAGLDTLVLASPKTSMEQIVGRILRQKKEDRINTPLVLDICDNFSFYPSQYQKRRKYYKSQNYVFLK